MIIVFQILTFITLFNSTPERTLIVGDEWPLAAQAHQICTGTERSVQLGTA